MRTLSTLMKCIDWQGSIFAERSFPGFGLPILYSPVVQGVGAAPADGASAVLVQVGLGAGAVLVRLAASSGGSGRGGRVGGCGGVGSVVVEHPPAGLARALVLHAHELAVQRQVVSDGVLQ